MIIEQRAPNQCVAAFNTFVWLRVNGIHTHTQFSALIFVFVPTRSSWSAATDNELLINHFPFWLVVVAVVVMMMVRGGN